MLSDQDITLRFVRESDLDALIAHSNNLAVRGQYLPAMLHHPDKMRQQFKENGLSSEDFERLLIVDENDQLLGTLWHFKSVPYFNAREIGYILFATEQRNRNIMSRAVRLLVDYLFSSRMLNRLEIRMDVRNLASEKVAIKLGFTKEGVARGANFVHGEHVDMAVYALLRQEWAAQVRQNE